MRTTRCIWTFVALAVLVGGAVGLGTGEDAPLVKGEYYLFSLGPSPADPSSLSQALEAEGYTIVEYAEDGSVARTENVPGGQTDSALLQAAHLLVVDGSRFLLRADCEEHEYTVRPAQNGLELVFSPKLDQGLDRVVSVLFELQKLSVIGAEVDLQYRAFEKDALKGPQPPAEVRIESDLYQLTVAEDWFAFAASKGIERAGLRVRVVAELESGVVLQDPFAAYVSSASDSLARLLIPIEQLVLLASTEGVVLVRLPYEPVAP